MSKADWSKAPEGAMYFTDWWFYKIVEGVIFCASTSEEDFRWRESMCQSKAVLERQDDFEINPLWLPEEKIIDVIATSRDYATAESILTEGLSILSQRGQQYGSEGRECSFAQAATAFNSITGHNLQGSDVCLILALVKQVRQYAQPDRFHHDSAVDAVNYLALQGQELERERKV